MFRLDRYDSDTSDLSLKHMMKNLVQWIEYCTKLDYPYISMSSELSDSEDLRELFVSLYIRYVKSAIDRGPFYRYEDQTEEILNSGEVSVRGLYGYQ
jgi:5-methylcytosine-specific restriction endonuclease McrBC regulatory subunit McrC